MSAARQLSVVLWDERGHAWGFELAVPAEVKAADAYEIAMRFAQMVELQLTSPGCRASGAPRPDMETRHYLARPVS